MLYRMPDSNRSREEGLVYLLSHGIVLIADSYVLFSKQSAIDEIKLLILSITFFFFLQLLHCELLHLLLLRR